MQIDLAFIDAAKNRHVKVLKIDDLTQDSLQREAMIHADSDYLFKRAIASNKLSTVQFLMSVTSELETIVNRNTSSIIVKYIKNSIDFITKLSEVKNQFPEMLVSSIFSMKIFAINVYNFI
ncbi:MAG: hypothetical protein AB8U25_00505 [Rickettsiales endosymbiont of Dermacentor nuttalli]